MNEKNEISEEAIEKVEFKQRWWQKVKPGGKRDAQIARMENVNQEVFGLVRSIRDNLDAQIDSQNKLVHFMSALPEVAEGLKKVGESTEYQKEVLGAIKGQMEEASSQNMKIAGSMDQFSSTLNTMDTTTRTILDGAREREDNLKDMLERSELRSNVLMTILFLLLASALYLGWSLTRSGSLNEMNGAGGNGTPDQAHLHSTLDDDDLEEAVKNELSPAPIGLDQDAEDPAEDEHIAGHREHGVNADTLAVEKSALEKETKVSVKNPITKKRTEPTVKDTSPQTKPQNVDVKKATKQNISTEKKKITIDHANTKTDAEVKAEKNKSSVAVIQADKVKIKSRDIAEEKPSTVSKSQVADASLPFKKPLIEKSAVIKKEVNTAKEGEPLDATMTERVDLTDSALAEAVTDSLGESIDLAPEAERVVDVAKEGAEKVDILRGVKDVKPFEEVVKEKELLNGEKKPAKSGSVNAEKKKRKWLNLEIFRKRGEELAKELEAVKEEIDALNEEGSQESVDDKSAE